MRSARVPILAIFIIALASLQSVLAYPEDGNPVTDTAGETPFPDEGGINDAKNEPDGTEAGETGSSGADNGQYRLPEGLDPEAAFIARMSGLFEAEDPTSLYSFDIKDQEVEFFLDGTWETNLASALTISFDTEGSDMSIEPPVFTQSVDLSTWIFINKTWYFEASFAEEFTRNTVAAGYMGNDETVVKHVRLGNSGIVFPDWYPFIEVGGGKAIAPGAMGNFAGDTWDASAIVRYDAAKQREMILSGMNEITDEHIPLENPVTGKWFVLPSTMIHGTMNVYIEDENGTYRDTSQQRRRWRKLDQAEYRVFGIEGILELDSETMRSVAVSYTGDWSDGSGGAGASLRDFVSETRDWFETGGNILPSEILPDPADPDWQAEVSGRFITAIDGNDALILSERGHFSPFILASRYRCVGTGLSIVNQETGIESDYLSVSGYSTSWAEIFRTDDLAPDQGTYRLREPASRFPLAPEFPRLYLFSGDEDSGLVVRSRSYTPIGTIALGPDVIAGTVQVTRNGVADKAFKLEQESGLITLDRPPSDGETVRITWYETDSSARNATLTVAGGIRWEPTDVLSFTLASALRWNISKDGYTDSEESSAGSLIASAGTKYSGEELSASTAFAVELRNPDMTGYYRLLGMERSSGIYYPSSDWYVRTPAAIEPVIGLPVFGQGYGLHPDPLTLESGDRIEPDGVNEDDEIPSTTSSSVSGAIMSLSAVFTSPDQWTSAEILIGDLGKNDFRGTKSISLTLRNEGARSDYDVFLQLGARAEEYYEDPATVRTWKLETPTAADQWVVRTVTLSDEDRAALTAGQNLRVILRPSAAAAPAPSIGEPMDVRLYTAKIELTSTGFTASAEPAFSGDGLLYATERADPKQLENFASDPVDRFNSGNINRVLEVSFTPESDTDRVLVSRYFPELPFGDYENLSFFLYPAASPDSAEFPNALVRLSLTRPRSDGPGFKTALECEIPSTLLTAGSWHRIRVSLKSGTVEIDGSAAGSARVVRIDRDVLPVRAQISFEGWELPDGWVPGGEEGNSETDNYLYRVYLDEFYLSETESELIGRNETLISWKREGAVLTLGGVEVLSNPDLSVTANSSIGNGRTEASAYGTARAALDVLTASAEGTMTASSNTARLADSAGYTVRIPVGPVSLREYYYSDFAGNTFERDDSFSLAGPLPLELGTNLEFAGRTLDRSMSFELSPSTPYGAPGQLSFKAASDFSQSGTSPRTDISDTSWQTLWGDSAWYAISTGEEDAHRRTGDSSVALTWDTPWGKDGGLALSSIRLGADALSSYNAVSTVSLDSELGMDLSFPINLGRSVITPSWRRSSGISTLRGAGGDYRSDTESLFEDIGRMDYFLSVAPVYDLFRDGMADMIRDGGSSREFSNRYGIDWQRISSSSLSDLVVPNLVNSYVMRETSTDAVNEDIRDIWTASIRAGFSALNIAGRYSAAGTFPWYTQDEISQLYTWTSKWGNSYFTWSVDTWHSLLLFFEDGGTVSLENSFHYDSPSISGANELTRDTVSFLWKRPGKDSLLTALVDRFTDLPLSTRREEDVSLSLSKSEDFSFSVSFDHTLATEIGSNGEVSVTAGSGFSRFSDGTRELQIRLGLGGKLTY